MVTSTLGHPNRRDLLTSGKKRGPSVGRYGHCKGPGVRPDTRTEVGTRYPGGPSPVDVGGVLVGAPGFEPGTSCAQGKRATRLRHAPMTYTVSCGHSSKTASNAVRRLCTLSILDVVTNTFGSCAWQESMLALPNRTVNSSCSSGPRLHLQGGFFDQGRTLALIDEIRRGAKEQGFPRIRFVTHMEWRSKTDPAWKAY